MLNDVADMYKKSLRNSRCLSTLIKIVLYNLKRKTAQITGLSSFLLNESEETVNNK
jgi:hypothetical protein